jgi:hypothetical protein
MADERVDLWATDEVHFQQHGSRCQMWGLPGQPSARSPTPRHAQRPTRAGDSGAFDCLRLASGGTGFAPGRKFRTTRGAVGAAGPGGQKRPDCTVPVPGFVKARVDARIATSGLTEGALSRLLGKGGIFVNDRLGLVTETSETVECGAPAQAVIVREYSALKQS